MAASGQTEKLKRLRSELREMGSVAVAFSSGVDSTFLLRVAHEVLGDHVAAVTISSPLIPRHELDDAATFCRVEGIRHEIIDFDVLSVPVVADNPPDRCYHCKKAVFGKIVEFAQAHGLAAVVEGSNVDDDGDYRPGRRAIRELGRDGIRPSRSDRVVRGRSPSREAAVRAGYAVTRRSFREAGATAQ